MAQNPASGRATLAAMKRRAELDPRLGVRILAARRLAYDAPAAAGEDRPAHVRAASGLAFQGGRLFVVQDDAAFVAVVAGESVTALLLPRGSDGRRRFELALGNREAKLDLEACLAVDGELWAFGSGSLPVREQIVRVDGADVRLVPAGPFYASLRAALGGALNLEGVARVGAALWLFHRGNTGADDGPAVLEVELEALRRWLDGRSALPVVGSVVRYDLGALDGARLGFSDACADPCADHGRVLYLATAEAAADAVADGPVLGSQLGVIEDGAVRAAPLRSSDGRPLKAEGLALDPARPDRAWIALDPDAPDEPAELLEVELTGPW
jgi:uncharacterized protein DUF6929